MAASLDSKTKNALFRVVQRVRRDMGEAERRAWQTALARRCFEGIGVTFTPSNLGTVPCEARNERRRDCPQFAAFNTDSRKQGQNLQDFNPYLDALPDAVFEAQDSLGWSFQFWREKGAPGTLSTQLFTDAYMVDFLLDNSLGAWMAYRNGEGKSSFLRMEKAEPAVGPFPDWPQAAKALRIMDPCCGGGNFLVAAFAILAPLRATEEGLSVEAAADIVLRDNLFGLDVDPDCVECAVWALQLAAARFSGKMPGNRPNVVAPDPIGDNAGVRLLGSLMPEAELLRDSTPFARLLYQRYHLVATNVPFLARGKQSPFLRDFCAEHYPDAQRDLASVFLCRCLELCAAGGVAALVSPQNWLFLKSYQPLRSRLLGEVQWRLAARLGEGAFDRREAAGAFSALLVAVRSNPAEDDRMALLDVSPHATPDAKAHALRNATLHWGKPADMRKRTAGSILFSAGRKTGRVGDYAQIHTGLQTGDNPRYIRYFWELPTVDGPWVFQQSTPLRTEPCAGREQVLFWEDGQGALARDPQARVQGLAALGKQGIALRLMRTFAATLYDGDMGDQTAALIIPKNADDLPALWAYFASAAFTKAVREVDGKVNLAPATVGKAALDIAHWRRKATALPDVRTDDPTQWSFHGRVESCSHPLHAAMAALLGYSWPKSKVAYPKSEGVLNLSPGAHLERAAARLRALLARAYGTAWNAKKETALLEQSGAAEKGLGHWLRHEFFKEHVQLFHRRPFLWQIWDGKRHGFSAVVNYHQLDYTGLEQLIHDHLDPWIAHAPAHLGKSGQALQHKLHAILKGDAPHDIFVRWKAPNKQAEGWRPDLNDGVRLNMRPFVMGGVLRQRFAISWKPDRGANPPNAPWHEEFDGERRNDHHIRLDEKINRE
jgi:hypothetical protein